jgi:hypothetical protein
MSRILGSLQMAVILLVAFAAVLAVGTVVESRFTGRIAQELVYRTWWFALLLTFLSVNILFAALKKWPWKKHQTGFLITHLGLLTMLAGGVWNAASGTDALVELVDSAEPAIQRETGSPNSTNLMQIPDEYVIRVKHGEKPAQEFPFHHGSFAWRSDDFLRIEQPVWVTILQRLANPLPESWRRDLGDGIELSVENVYPHVRQEPFSPVSADHASFPAAKVQLWSPQFGRLPAFWTAMSTDQSPDRERRQWAIWSKEPALVEFVGTIPAELLPDFLKPPPPEALGPKGQLVLHYEGGLHRIPVEDNLGRVVPLGDGGRSVRLTKYQGMFASSEVHAPFDPAVFYEFHEPGQQPVKLVATTRLNLRSGFEDATRGGQRGKATPVEALYHPPDYRYGSGDRVRGLLQLARAKDGSLHYRSFHYDAGAFRLEAAGLARDATSKPDARSDQISIWSGMKWRFQVQEYLPHAVAKDRYVPENARPGLRRRDLMTALRCKVKTKSASTEFWITDRHTRRVVQVGDEQFEFAFLPKQEDMGFTIKLLRAEQRVDEGTQNPATYTSFVQVTDDGHGDVGLPPFLQTLTNFLGLTKRGAKAEGEDHVITMNAPLEWRGHKLFMNTYLPADMVDSRDRPVNIAQLTVGRDPGLFLKYLGSSMLALGITCMFYMRAYFFRPQGRTGAASPEVDASKATTTWEDRS